MQRECTHVAYQMRVMYNKLSMLEYTRPALMKTQVSNSTDNSNLLILLECKEASHCSFPGGPVLETLVGFHLLTALSSHPPSFTLNCTSSHSPPTMVTWTRNGETLTSSSPYSISRVLKNAVSTTYNSLLTVQGSLEGEYSCAVANDRGSNSATLTVVGMLTVA